MRHRRQDLWRAQETGRRPVRLRSGKRSPAPNYSEVKPRYTRLALKAGIQGAVLLEAVVLKDGTVGRAIVTRSLDQTFGLDQQAITAAQQWKFTPGYRNGEPVDVLVTIELTFTMR